MRINFPLNLPKNICYHNSKLGKKYITYHAELVGIARILGHMLELFPEAFFLFYLFVLLLDAVTSISTFRENA
jgi:hypothetical protein